jgi:hypothetical protein
MSGLTGTWTAEIKTGQRRIDAAGAAGTDGVNGRLIGILAVNR